MSGAGFYQKIQPVIFAILQDSIDIKYDIVTFFYNDNVINRL